ncbi:MAG: tetracycline resistance MFS efflux pump [Patescibacteria group bacterium]|nr:MAG: tetracycline resistance MFS efflux pump [Patescibacteria group bacterium]
MASYSLFQFLASPILGRLSDKYGRKPILAISLFGSALGYFLIAIANNIWLIFASRIIDGITGGNISVAQAYIADITKGKERTKAMGLIGMAFGLGFVFGPAIGGFLGHYFLALPYLFAGLLALLNCIFILFFLPETVEKNKVRSQPLFDLQVIKEVFKPKIVLKLTLTFFMITLSFSLMQGMLPLYTQYLFGWGERQVGYFFAYIGLINVFSQGYLLRRVINTFSEDKLVKFSTLVLCLVFLGLAVLRSIWLFYLTAFFLAVFFGIFNATVQSLISKNSDQNEQGVVLGTVQSFGSLARTLGPVIGGILYSLSPQLPFLSSSGLIFLTFLGI